MPETADPEIVGVVITAVAVAPDPVSPAAVVIVTVGVESYPAPAVDTAIAVTVPPDNVAVTTACVPPASSGAPTVTVGAAAVEV